MISRLKFEGFSCFLGDVRILQNINFQVEEGEIVAVLGRSGIGKSVLYSSLLQLSDSLRYEGNATYYDGKDNIKIDKHSIDGLLGKEISVVFQDHNRYLNPFLNVGEQTIEKLLQIGVPRDVATSMALELFAEVRLDNPELVFTQMPYELSGGMKQRVMFAIVLLLNIKLLFADEIESSLDFEIKRDVLETLRSICKRRKISSVWVTHSIKLAPLYADKIVVLSSEFKTVSFFGLPSEFIMEIQKNGMSIFT